MNNSTDHLNCRSFSSGRNSWRQALQREEMNADPNLQTKPKIRIRRLWLPSTLSEFRVISSQELHWLEDKFLVLTPLIPHGNHKHTMTLRAPAAYIYHVFITFISIFVYILLFMLLFCVESYYYNDTILTTFIYGC